MLARQDGARTTGRVIAALPTALVLVAEAAWVTVVAGMLQAFTLVPPTLGYPWFLLAAVAGLAAARGLETRAGDRWPLVVAVLAIATGLVGWLLAPDVRAVLAAQGLGGLGDAIVANIGGWLGAVAFVRGVAHARLPADPHRIGNLLGLAVPGLAGVAILGGMVAEPTRGAFLGEAQVEVLVFLVAGISALALARLGLVASGAAVDWRRNPAWLGLLVGLLAVTAVLAIAVSVFAGPVIVAGLGALLTPLLIVGFFVGFDRRSFMILVLSVLGTAAVATLLQLFASQNPSPPPATPAGGVPTDSAVVATTPIAIGVLGIVIGVAVIAILLLARLWLRRPREEPSDVPETREIDRGERDADPRARRRGRFSRRPAVRDAVAAYRALLEALETEPDLRRRPEETPAEHAARLRDHGRGDLSLDLLAADYGLVRFGGHALTPREHRRAVTRGTTLRRRLPGR
jgi:multisubunit Na+/H+ antiporter MnhC subunit